MDIDTLRARFLERRTEIEGRLTRITQDVRHAGQLPADFEEQVVERENDEVLAGLDNSIRAEITSIDGALTRLELGTYGTCVKCRKPITPARLEAQPYATRCVGCEAKA